MISRKPRRPQFLAESTLAPPVFFPTPANNSMSKDTDEQPDEEIHRARSGRVLSAGASVPGNWGAPPSQCVNAFTNPVALRTLSF